MARATRLLPAAIVLAAGAALLVALPPRRLVLPARQAVSTPTVVAGVSHVHTSRSDGTGTPDEIAAAAARVGLDFVVLTDHGDGTRPPDPPQYRDGVLCLDGVEISTAEGHYLAIGLPRAPYPLGGEARDVVEDVRRLGGLGVVAHPDSAKPELQWRAWDVPFDGIEWINGDTEWRDEGLGRLALALVTYPIRPVETLASLLDAPVDTLRRWDALTQSRRVPGLAGSDAHARIGWGGDGPDPYRDRVLLRLPSYETVFSALSMRVALDRPLSGEAEADAAALLAALKAGRIYTVIEGLATPGEMDVVARSGGRLAGPGARLVPDGPVEIEVQTNALATSSIVLYQDGRQVAQQMGARLKAELGEVRGVFRAEVRLPGRAAAVPWMASNPIYVLPEEPADPAQDAVLGPVTETQRLEAATSGRPARAEQRPGSTIDIDLPGQDRVAVRYTLGAGPDQYVALVVPVGSTGLARFDRLSFVAFAGQPLRLSVQLRQPAGLGDADGQRWRRSVYLDTIARAITVSFDEMRAAGRTDAAEADLGRVQDLLFVVDTTYARPGSTGTFNVEGLRLER